MLELPKKTQLILNKVILELQSSILSPADIAQLFVFCYDNPSITYLGLLERAEKYLPTNVNLPKEQLDGLSKVYWAYKNLVDRSLSPVAIRNYANICIKIRLREIVYSECWYIPFFVKFVKEINPKDYLEFEGWEEVLLVPAILGQSRIDVKKMEISTIKEFYLKNKLKVKSISKLHNDMAVAAISSREMKWETMSLESLKIEKENLEKSNLFGKDIYLQKLENEFKV